MCELGEFDLETLRVDPDAHLSLYGRGLSIEDGVDPCVVAALPAVVAIVSDPATVSRGALLRVLGGLSEVGSADWTVAWERERSALVALLSDDDPLVRGGVVYALGAGGGDVLPVLLRHWETETDPAVRLDVVHAVAALQGMEWLRALPVDDPQVRMARAAALKLGHEEYLPGLFGDTSAWQDVAWMWETHGPWSVTRWAVDQQIGVQERTDLLVSLAADPRQRRDVATAMYQHLVTHRSPASAFTPVLAGFLTDPEPEVRAYAAGLLGGLRAREHADAIAALLPDPQVGDMAIWALTRFGIVPSQLASRIPSWGSGSVPSLAEVLTPIGDHASLIPVVRSHLRDASCPDHIRGQLAQVLGAWKVADAVPDLVAVLDVPDVRRHVLRALGRIGVMVPELEPVDAISAWAWWRCGGSASLAAEVIAAGSGRMLWGVAGMLAEIGPEARAVVDRLPLEDPFPRIRLMAWFARWRITGEPGALVPTCLEVLDGMEHGRAQPGMCEAIEALQSVGVRPSWVDAALASDHRFDSPHGWGSFDHDVSVRQNLSLL